jgi:outer membrane protein OmpA-like peptidoglycan-associated protein
MKILLTGVVAFVIWCFISAWLYNDILLPVIKKPVPVQTIPEPQSSAADSLAQLKASMPATLMIYFEFDKSKFKPDPQTDNSVAALRTWLEKYPSSILSVTGHTDLVGTPEYNLDLGLKRAVVVGKYLEEMRISGNKMILDSKGETEPAADYLTAEGRAKNRRTEISIKMQ